jgi:hypothetical protein
MNRRAQNVENERKRDKKTGKFMPENRPKSHVISFRLSEEELVALYELANMAKVSPCIFAKLIVLIRLDGR